MTGRFWEVETPQTAQNRFIKVEYFPQAGKLSIEKTNPRDGVSRPRRVTLDYRDFRNPEVVQLFETVISDWKNKPVEGDGV